MRDLSASGSSFTSHFDTEEGSVEDSVLLDTYAAYKKCFFNAPVSTDAPDADKLNPFESIPGDEVSEVKNKIYEAVVTARRNKQVFIPARDWARNIWSKDGEGYAIFQKSKFATAPVGEAGKKNNVMVLFPELFPTKDQFQSATAHRDPVVWRSEMNDAFTWMMTNRDESTVAFATDARNTKIRMSFQTIVNETTKDETKHIENWIMYKGHPSKRDIRFPTRQVFGALQNMEAVVGLLPVPRVRMNTRHRLNFSACGETNTHTRSYSGVPWRSLSSLPRMGLEAKDGLTGITSPAYDKAVSDETRKKGHPLFWKETLDVEWLVAAFSDLHATRIFDLCAGSGAAACAAVVLDIPYEGIAMNAKHAAWLNNIMDRAIFAILQLREVPKDSKGHRDPDAAKFKENVMLYFKDLVEEGRKYVERELDASDDDELCDDCEDDDNASNDE